MSSLFRKEAIDHQRTRLWGEVLIVQPKSFKWLVMVFLLGIAAVAVFASLQSYKRKETVMGFLVPKGGLAKVSSERGGIVTEVLVENGQAVKAGQNLIKIVQPRNTASGQNNDSQLKASLSRELEAVNHHLEHMEERYQREVMNLEKRLKGRKQEVATLRSELELIKQQQRLAESQRKGAEQLKQKGFVSKNNVDSLLSRELDLQQQGLNRQRLLDSMMVDISNLRNEIEVKTPHYFEEERMNLERRGETLMRELASVELSSAYTLTAAIAGVVGNLIVNNGEMVVPGRALMSLRPKNSKLIARLLVPSRAAGLIEVGQGVKIQYDAFPYQRFGVFNGDVLEVSQGVRTPSEMPVPVAIQEAFYLVDVELESQAITAQGKDVLLKSGMQLKADIVLEERSLLEWIFEPLLSISGRL
ncbi:HlyD family efflux transporter periplasmic adaptor subunit [Pseudoteredinibacter isoporae]|uniref:HlyD family efflux transporter periplasmic adaptor subunit n=1 Tax=Pseudoteredinibacter isoporae TaxID=570281 RepID=UPI00310B0D7E